MKERHESFRYNAIGDRRSLCDKENVTLLREEGTAVVNDESPDYTKHTATLIRRVILPNTSTVKPTTSESQGRKIQYADIVIDDQTCQVQNNSEDRTLHIEDILRAFTGMCTEGVIIHRFCD